MNDLQRQIISAAEGLPDFLIGKKVDLSEHVPLPEPLLRQDSSDTILFTKGNISCIAGSEKSRKTFLVTAIAAALLGDEQLTLSGVLENPKVVIIDTEQDISDTHVITRRVHRLLRWDCSHSNDKLAVYNLRELDVSQRNAAVEKILEVESPSVCFIDGVVDLCEDFNDLKESRKVIDRLGAIASQTRTHICICIHFNKGTTELRGHIGSLIKQKSELVIGVEAQDGYSDVLPLRSRRKPFDKFSIAIDDKALPYLYNPPQATPKTDKLKALFEEAFKDLPTTVSYTLLRDNVMKLSSVKERAAEKKIEQAICEGIVKKNDYGYYLPVKIPENEQLPF